MGPLSLLSSFSACKLRGAGSTDYEDVVALYAYIKARRENGETVDLSWDSSDGEKMSPGEIADYERW